jgi:hypothetical protein
MTTEKPDLTDYSRPFPTNFKDLCQLLQSRHLIPELAAEYGGTIQESLRLDASGQQKPVSRVRFCFKNNPSQVIMYFFSESTTSVCTSTGEEIEYLTWSATLLYRKEKFVIGEEVR